MVQVIRYNTRFLYRSERQAFLMNVSIAVYILLIILIVQSGHQNRRGISIPGKIMLQQQLYTVLSQFFINKYHLFFSDIIFLLGGFSR